MAEYARARLIRIYVPYLPIGVGIYLLYLLLPGLSEGGRTPGVLTSFTLLPSNHPPALSVAWTLVHEMIFYTIYGLTFVHRRLFQLVFGTWVVAILATALVAPELPLLARYFFSPLNLCFVLGVAIFHLNARYPCKRLAAVITCGGIGLALVASQAMLEQPNRIIVALGFGALVWAAASPGIASRPAWRPLVVLGAASYAIYLVHNPVLSVLVRLLPDGIPTGGAYVLISAGALMFGLLYWRIYERPMLGWVRRWLPARVPVAQAGT